MLSINEVDFLMLRNHVFRQRNEQKFAVQPGKDLDFSGTLESCFKAWKRSHMCCSALLCGRFDDSQESRFEASKRSNMSSDVLEGGGSADIHEFCFQAANFQI